MANKKEGFAETVINTMKAHFGDAAKAFWVYEDAMCPCCSTRNGDHGESESEGRRGEYA